MASMTSTLTLQLIDDVSKPARSVAQALGDAKKNLESVTKAMANTGASDKFVASLSKLKLAKTDIESVAKALTDYSRVNNLAADSSQWTTKQARGFRELERQAISSLSEVQAEQSKFAAANRRLANSPPPAGTFKPGALLSGAVGLYGAQKAEQFAAATLTTYREYSDINAIMRPVLDLTPAEQARMKAQQLQLGVDSRYSPVQVAEAQKLLGERGVDKNLIAPYVSEAVNYASAMNVGLPEAIKTLEAYMFSTGKLADVTDPAKALAIVRKVTDFATHLSKISGLPDEEISAFFEYGGLSGHQAGLSDSTVGAMAALMKRNQISGDKAGVAIRAISAKLVSPTGKGLTALAAMGINYDNFVHAPEKLSAVGVGLAIKQNFGKALTPRQMAAISKKLADEDVVTSRSEFVHQLGDIISSSFLTKKGKVNVNDAKQLAKVLGKFYGAAASGVDTEGLLRAIMKAGATLAELNDFFGFQQGSRAGAALQNEPAFDEKKAQLENTEPGFAKKIADERLASFDGAVKQLEGSISALQIHLANSFDDAGKGGALTSFVNELTTATNLLIKLPDPLTRLSTEAAAAAVAFATLKSAGGIAGALGLTGASSFIEAIASGVKGGLIAGAAYLVGKEALDWTMGWTPEKEQKFQEVKSGAYQRTFFPDVKTDTSSPIGPTNTRANLPYLDNPDLQGIGNEMLSHLTAVKAKSDEAKAALDQLAAGVTLHIDGSELQRALAQVSQLVRALHGLGGSSSMASALGATQRGHFSFGGVQGE